MPKDETSSTFELDEILEDVQGEQVEEKAGEVAADEVPASQELPEGDAPAPTSDAPVEVDEMTSLREQVRLLTEQVNVAYQQPVVASEVEAPNTAESPSDVLDASKLFGDWTYDAIVDSEDSFKKFLTDFATNLTTQTEERLLKKLPFTVSKLTTEQMEARQHVQSFYTDHPQLAAVKPFVAKLVSTVASEHADWDLPKVLTESAVRAYSALGLKQAANSAPAQPADRRPAFAGPASGKRGSVPQGKSKLESEIEELLNLE